MAPATSADEPPVPVGVPEVLPAVPGQRQPELVACRSFSANFRVPASDVEPLVPSAYMLEGTGLPLLASLSLQVESCESAILDNETVIMDARLSFLKARVRPNESLSAGSDVSHYALEVFASHATVADVWTQAGIDATVANIEIEEAETIVVRIQVGNATWYEVTAGPRFPQEAAETRLAIRHHRLAPDGTPAWFDHNRTYRLPSEPSPAVIDVEGGLLAQVDPADQGRIPAESWLGESRGTVRFGRAS